MRNSIDLKGRVAVVTGGATGIGEAIVDAFADSGAQVAIWDLDTSKPGRAHFAATTDVAKVESISQAHADTVSALGPVDILVNNAGYGGPIATALDYPIEEWHRIMRINLDGVLHTCRAVLPSMRERGYGRIINIASLAGKEGTPGAAPYSVSKAGVIALTKALGKENADRNVIVNAIAPAAIETAMLDQFTEEHVQIMIDKSPMGRLGRVEEVASLTAWLASEDCSFSTGAVHDLSGGRATY